MKTIKSFSRISNPLMLFAVVLFLFSSCGQHQHEGEHEHGEEEEHHHQEGATAVDITAAQFKQLDIQLGAVEMKNLSSTLRATGVLKVPPTHKANITSALGGTVHDILVMEGDYVKKGQTIATLVNPDFIRLQQDYLDTQSQLVFAEANYARQKELSEKNVTAQKTFQEATASYNSLKAKVNALQQQLALLNINTSSLTSDNIASVISVKSPINGNISHIDINIGTTVEPSNELMDVVDNSQLHLDLFIFEQDITKISTGQTVDITLTNLPGKHYTAKIFAIGSAFEGESKTIPVHAAITGDKNGLIEGMNVTANINIGSSLTPAVLTTAIVSNAGNDFIFIQIEGHAHEEHDHAEKENHEQQEHEEEFSFERIPVKKGVTQDIYTEITLLKEIPDTVKVVNNGAFYLMSMLTNEGEGHEH